MNSLPAKLRRRLHLKFLLRSIFVLVVGVVSFEVMTIYKMSTLAQELTLDKVSNVIDSYSRELNNEIADIKSDNELIANLPALQAYYMNARFALSEEAEQSFQSIQLFFSRQKNRNTAYTGLILCDRNNTKLNDIFSTDESVLLHIQQYFFSICQLPIAENTPPLFINYGERFFVGFRHPIARDHENLGQVGLIYEITPFFSRFGDSQPQQSGGICILGKDQNKTFLPLYQRGEISLPKSIALETIKNQSFVENVIDKNGDNQGIFLQPVAEIPWILAVSVNKNEIFSPVYNQVVLAASLVLVLIVIEVFFLNLFTRNLITNRLQKLLLVTREILAGNFAERVDVSGNDEISELAISFNTMAASLQLELENLENKQKKLEKSESRLQSILDNTSALIYIKNLDGRYLLVNRALEKVLSSINKSIVNGVDKDIFIAQDSEQFRKNDQAVIEAGKPLSFEENITLSDDQTMTYLVIKFPLFDDNNEIYATCGISTDITDRKVFELQLQQLNQRLKLNQAVIESSQEGILITDKAYRIIQVNPSLCRLFGYSEKELIGQTPKLFRSEYHDQQFFNHLYQSIETKGTWHGEIWEKTKSGEIIPQLLTVTAVRDDSGAITHFSGIYADISDLKQTQERLHQLAHYDSLTTLANRVLLENRTEQAIELARRSKSMIALLFIDLDNFKYINDTLGHSIGDLLLKAIAERLIRIVRDSDTVARQGGDEFVILLTNLSDKDDALLIAEKARAIMNEPFSIKGQELFASSSIGVALYPEHADNALGLLKCADIAMYSAKESGKNSSRLFTSQMNHAALDRLSIEKSLRHAIDEDEFEVFYQPIISSSSLRIEKLESLIRWKRDDQFMAPDVFIPIAEESGLIIKIGELVLMKSCEALKSIRKKSNMDIKLNVNLSARQFRFPNLAERLNEIVEAAELRADDFEFEITESLLVEDYKLAKRILLQLKHYGFTLALDDFGTGYSSLSYLNLFPLDTLKMDKTFVKDIGVDDRSEAILTASITMGQALGMKIVCEGIETRQQAQFISELGNVQLQGYFFAKPMPLDKTIAYINDRIKNRGYEYD